MRNCVIAVLLVLAIAAMARATETENLGVRILPAPGEVTIDGKFDDWDLSGGVFICGDVESNRGRFSSWLHLMYDNEILYGLLRIKDKHPLVNSRGADAETVNVFDARRIHGDRFVMRIITGYGTPNEHLRHIVCWQGKDGLSVMTINDGTRTTNAETPDVQKLGGAQAFLKDADANGYTHEFSIPTKLLTKDERSLKAGDALTLTVEQAYSWNYAIKDIFKAGVKPNRTFTARSYECWGPGTFEATGKVKLQPLRLSDGRLLDLSFRRGLPVIDWSGLRKTGGLKAIEFTMPEDGYVSLNIKNADGIVVRQLLNSEPRTKGANVVMWDGLTTPHWKTPGEKVEPGEYTWSAIYHTGIGLRLRGWANHGPSDPWDISPTTYWGGDQALPLAIATDDEKIYFGWAGSEAGKALVACGLNDDVQWAAGYHFNGASIAQVDEGIVYYVNGRNIKRVSDKDGKPVNWPGTKSGTFGIKTLWKDPAGMPTSISWPTCGFEVHKGKMYLGFSTWSWEWQDITNWRSFLAEMVASALPGKDHSPLSKAIWDKLDDRCKKTIKGYLEGDKSPEEAFKTNAYWVPDARKVVVSVMSGLLSDKTLVKGGEEMTNDELLKANRRLFEKTFKGSVMEATSNFVAVVDIKTMKVVKTLEIKTPGRIMAVKDDLFYIFSERSKILKLDPNTGGTSVFLKDLEDCRVMASDKDGNVYVAKLGKDNQILKYSPEGKLLLKIGKKGGRVRLGPWDPSGMNNAWGLGVDAKDRIWVAECDIVPRRMSAWDINTGKFVKEYLGPTHYGGSGGSVNPRDPSLVVSEGGEFRIDPETGQSKLIGIITQEVFHGLSRFCEGANGKQYFTASFNGRVWGPGVPRQIRIWERIGDGQYKYRAVIRPTGNKTYFWADANDDEEEQPEEITTLPVQYTLSGYNNWSMNLNTDLTFYGSHKTNGIQVKVKGFTACNAPIYDLENAKELPPTTNCTLSSPDNRLILSCGEGNNYFHCYDVETGKKLWTYPNTFTGVHGSHGAPGPSRGLIRGAFGIIGNAQMPDPIGALWVINTNVGEWHALTEDGYYLTPLFQGKSNKREWPEKAVPGAVMDNCPSGLGGEDFGGSAIQGKDGNLYLASGKVAFWNVEVVGLDTVKTLAQGSVTITASESVMAQVQRGRELQAIAKYKTLTLKEHTPKFTGSIGDFKGAKRISYQKESESSVTSVASYDDKNLYLGWDVKDTTPWINGADEPAYMYSSGDTVDFQIGTDPNAAKGRGTPIAGDLRLSIGLFDNKPAAVIYRKVVVQGGRKTPKTFSSGVIKEHIMESVEVLEDATIEVKVRADGRNKGYTVEAAIPLATLGLEIKTGLKLIADFGVTHSDPNGQDTNLRTFWSNQATG
ncbi:MAG: hypothetical protein HQ592_01950, partial [Planctomycetes bacterium]|nr:hypothetical protein [Planctomycetota bacterium]